MQPIGVKLVVEQGIIPWDMVIRMVAIMVNVVREPTLMQEPIQVKLIMIVRVLMSVLVLVCEKVTYPIM